MTTPNSLHDAAERALRALDGEDFPQLKEDLEEAVNQEKKAAESHDYSIQIDMGGQDFIVYFNVTGGDTADEWIVAEGLQAFYKGIEITELFEGCDLDEAIYMKSNEVESMMADAWADHMIDQYADIDD